MRKEKMDIDLASTQFSSYFMFMFEGHISVS